jgi:hypothetical protein
VTMNNDCHVTRGSTRLAAAKNVRSAVVKGGRLTLRRKTRRAVRTDDEDRRPVESLRWCQRT